MAAILEKSIHFLMHQCKPALEVIGIFLNFLIFLLLWITGSCKRFDCYLKLITMTTTLMLVASFLQHDFNCRFFTCAANTTCSYCSDYIADSFITRVFDFYVQGIAIKLLLTVLTLSEIFMTKEKQAVVINSKRSLLMKTKFPLIFLAISVTAILINGPEFFAIEIVHGHNDTYEVRESRFGKSLYFTAYKLAYNFFVAMGMSIFYMILVFQTIKSFGHYMARKRRVMSAKAKKKVDCGEKNLLKIVIWIGVLRVLFVLFYFIRYFCLYTRDFFSIDILYILHLLIILMEILILMTFILNAIIIFRYKQKLRNLVICRNTYK